MLLQPRCAYTCTCIPPEPRRVRNRSMSLLGALPKQRLYSLLNCETLRYPTRLLAVLTSIIMDNIRCRASCRRSTFDRCVQHVHPLFLADLANTANEGRGIGREINIDHPSRSTLEDATFS